MSIKISENVCKHCFEPVPKGWYCCRDCFYLNDYVKDDEKESDEDETEE